MLVINHSYQIVHDMIQNWYVNSIDVDNETYKIELSRMWGADVIDLNIKIKRDKTDIGLYAVWTFFQGRSYTMALTKSDIADRSKFRQLIYFNFLKKIDECLT